MKISYTVDDAHDGREIRQLASSTLGLSAKLWKHIKWNGTILVNGKPCRDASLRVKAGSIARRASRPAARCTLRG